MSIIQSARDGDLASVKSLIKDGINVNEKGENNTTALHAACARGHTEVVDFLLSKGADVNAKTTIQYTPLMAAARSRNLNIIKLLMEKGADINAIDENGHTALMNTAAEVGVDSEAQAKCAGQLIQFGARINTQSKSGATALMKAAWFSVESVVSTLLEHGADISLTDEKGRTALDLANQRGNTKVVQLLSDSDPAPQPGFFSRLFRKQTNK